MKEFPICLTKIGGTEIAYSGGGYFRFFPYSYVRKCISASKYAMTYFHIGDLIHNKGGVMSKTEYETYFKEPGTLKNRLVRYVKSNLGTKGAFDKMSKLIKEEEFVSLSVADQMIDWENMLHINL